MITRAVLAASQNVELRDRSFCFAGFAGDFFILGHLFFHPHLFFLFWALL